MAWAADAVPWIYEKPERGVDNMIRELLLVNCNRWPVNPSNMPDVELGEPFDVKPIAWPVQAGMSHRGYLVLVTTEQYKSLRKWKRLNGLSLHNAGTKAKSTPIEKLLGSVGLELGGLDDE